MQVAGQGEEKIKSMFNTATTLIVGTKWSGKINTDNAYRKARTKYPEILQPIKVKDSEDRQMNWMSYKNINDWKYTAKYIYIDMNMIKDELVWISNTYFLVYFFMISMLKISHYLFSQTVYDPRCNYIILMMPGSQQQKKEDQLLNATEVYVYPVQEILLSKVCTILLASTQPMQQGRLFLLGISSNLAHRKREF